MDLKQLSRKAKEYMKPRNLLEKVKSAYYQYKRVLIRTKKPSKQEFIDVVKISAAGMILIGLLGFIMQVIFIQIIKV